MSEKNQSLFRYRLYGSPVSYYTAKVQSYLRYKALPFDLIRVNNKIAETVIKPATGGWRVIPVLYGSNTGYIQDSSVIIDALESLHQDVPVTPPGLKQQVVSALFELLGDDWLVFPAMHYRWNFKRYNLPHILKAFGQSRTPHWPKPIRWMGGIKNALKFGVVPRQMLGINPTNIPALEKWTTQLLDQLNAHFSLHDYLLGGRACHGDFSLYGPLHAHLASDPFPKEHLIKSRQHLQNWLSRMTVTPATTGDWLPADEVPATLIPILQWQGRDQLPYLKKVMAQTADWLSKNSKAEILPRFIGKTSYGIDSAVGTRLCAPYSQWMYQRVMLYIDRAETDRRHELETWLKQHGIAFDPNQPSHPIVFRASKVRRQ